MLGRMRDWTSAVADYTIGTLIVVWHFAGAERATRQVPPPNARKRLATAEPQ